MDNLGTWRSIICSSYIQIILWPCSVKDRSVLVQRSCSDIAMGAVKDEGNGLKGNRDDEGHSRIDRSFGGLCMTWNSLEMKPLFRENENKIARPNSTAN